MEHTKVWSSYSGEDVDCGLLGCDTVQSCRWLLMFRKDVSPRQSGLCCVISVMRRYDWLCCQWVYICNKRTPRKMRQSVPQKRILNTPILKTKMVGSFEKLVTAYRTTRHHSPEDNRWHMGQQNSERWFTCSLSFTSKTSRILPWVFRKA
jgi:hypothetical protein